MSEDFNPLEHFKDRDPSCDCHWCEVDKKLKLPFFGYGDKISPKVKKLIVRYRQMYSDHFYECVELGSRKPPKELRDLKKYINRETPEYMPLVTLTELNVMAESMKQARENSDETKNIQA